MELFPIGTVDATSTGTIDSVVYSFFEPNMGCTSNPVYTTLVTRFKNQTMLSRKKAEPSLTLNYQYQGIFTREYRQIEHFVDSKDDALTSFYAIDFSRPQTPSAIATDSGDWKCSITNTRYYSTIDNQKAYWVFVWDGNNFKLGNVTALVTNTSVTLDLDYGDISLANAQASGKIYPVYQVYFADNALSSFKTEDYIDENINLTEDGGFTYTGNVSFVSKYKI